MPHRVFRLFLSRQPALLPPVWLRQSRLKGKDRGTGRLLRFSRLFLISQKPSLTERAFRLQQCPLKEDVCQDSGRPLWMFRMLSQIERASRLQRCPLKKKARQDSGLPLWLFRLLPLGNGPRLLQIALQTLWMLHCE